MRASLFFTGFPLLQGAGALRLEGDLQCELDLPRGGNRAADTTRITPVGAVGL